MPYRPPILDPTIHPNDDDRILCARCMREIEGPGVELWGEQVCDQCYEDEGDLY